MFRESAKLLLDTLFDRVYDLESFLNWDINEREEALEIKIPEISSVYLIHQHNALEQIWLSSPISGGWHFVFNPKHGWIDTRGKRPFFLMLFSEFKPYIPEFLWKSSWLEEKSA
ncbi:frataxin-like protein [Holospora obtusa F1]|uniref:Frataxin-like protein n=1 Tax=Holospora obtusa F1 TaxID=1399147 RepID=W6TUM3_HOLOB|nr:frataxin domain-containing protein [Holospora obtusa]ETZ07422.1 frataxin-like protein [Holospora obtusa F1]